VIGAQGTSFTAQEARSILIAACAEAGFDPREVEPVRVGENAVFWLRSRSVVARVGRGQDRLAEVNREVQVARWLAERSVPAVRALDLPQPIRAWGHTVTLWESVGDEVAYGGSADLGSLLCRLHALEPPDELALPPADPCRRARACLARAGALTSADRRFLSEALDDVTARYGELSFSSAGAAVLHGDANVCNVFLSSDGGAVLGDLDTVAVGPRELDLVPTAVYHDRLGWLSEHEYSDFVDAYGFDVRDWPGYSLLAKAVELELVAWLAQNAESSGTAAAELPKRIATLRADTTRRTWTPFLWDRRDAHPN